MTIPSSNIRSPDDGVDLGEGGRSGIPHGGPAGSVSLSQTWAFPWRRRVSLHPNEEGLISQSIPEQSSEAFEVYHIIVTSQAAST